MLGAWRWCWLFGGSSGYTVAGGRISRSLKGVTLQEWGFLWAGRDRIDRSFLWTIGCI